MKNTARFMVLGSMAWCLGFGADPSRAVRGCCAADVDGDGRVDQADLDALPWVDVARGDLDGSGAVDGPDFALVESCQDVACPRCSADLSEDATVDGEDRQQWREVVGLDCRADLNRDGRICPRDLIVFDALVGSLPPLRPLAAWADLDGDGEVDGDDRPLLEALTDPATDCRMDLDRNGRVDVSDLWILLASWGSCTSPSVREPKNTADCGPPP